MRYERLIRLHGEKSSEGGRNNDCTLRVGEARAVTKDTWKEKGITAVRRDFGFLGYRKRSEREALVAGNRLLLF